MQSSLDAGSVHLFISTVLLQAIQSTRLSQDFRHSLLFTRNGRRYRLSLQRVAKSKKKSRAHCEKWKTMSRECINRCCRKENKDDCESATAKHLATQTRCRSGGDYVGYRCWTCYNASVRAVVMSKDGRFVIGAGSRFVIPP